MELKFNVGNFEKEVLDSEVPVLVDFYADWCGPCKMMGPIIDKLATEYEGQVKVGKINIDEQLELAQKYKVMSIPTILIFKNGVVVDTTVGAVSMNNLSSKLEKVLTV